MYPHAGDMVLVHGDKDEVWHAHIITVDTVSKTCQVHFYIDDISCPGKYRFGRAAAEKIMWDSILQYASGSWEGIYWNEIQT